MPVTALDPKTALVVIDLQKGLAGRALVHPFADVVAKAVRLARAFRQAKQPVVLVTVGFSPDGGDLPKTRVDQPMSFPATIPPEFFELVPELAPEPNDLLVRKRQPNAFYGTELDLQLRRRHVTGIVLAGIATSMGVEATARAAQERSYNVTFASDAMTDMDAATHAHCLSKIFPRVGEIDVTDAILAKLGGAA